MKDMTEILKNYTDIQLNKNGFTIRFDSQKHAMEAFKDLTATLKEMEKAVSEKGMGRERE